jgi:hypothetical protein
MSLLTLGPVGTSFAVSLTFLRWLFGDLLSGSSEISLEEGSQHQAYIFKYHHSLSYLKRRVQSGSFPLLLITFRFFFAGSSSLSPDDMSTTCATTEPQSERRRTEHSDERSSGASLTFFHPARLRLKRRSSSSSEFISNSTQVARRRPTKSSRKGQGPKCVDKAKLSAPFLHFKEIDNAGR